MKEAEVVWALTHPLNKGGNITDVPKELITLHHNIEVEQ